MAVRTHRYPIREVLMTVLVLLLITLSLPAPARPYGTPTDRAFPLRTPWSRRTRRAGNSPFP